MNASSRADEALQRIYLENNNRVFVCDDNDYDIVREVQAKIPKKNYERLTFNTGIKIKLLGIISKIDFLNIASEREKFERIANKQLITTFYNK